MLYAVLGLNNVSYVGAILGGSLVNTAWRVLSLRMEATLLRYGGYLHIFNKQPRAADTGWSSSLGVWRGANNSSP
jgi:hypothetical protein